MAAWPLGKLVSRIGVVIVGSGVVVLGLLIFTGTPLSSVWDRVRGMFSRQDDQYEDEEEELEEEPAPRRREPRVLHTEPGPPVLELPQDGGVADPGPRTAAGAH